MIVRFDKARQQGSAAKVQNSGRATAALPNLPFGTNGNNSPAPDSNRAGASLPGIHGHYIRIQWTRIEIYRIWRKLPRTEFNPARALPRKGSLAEIPVIEQMNWEIFFQAKVNSGINCNSIHDLVTAHDASHKP